MVWIFFFGRGGVGVGGRGGGEVLLESSPQGKGMTEKDNQ